MRRRKSQDPKKPVAVRMPPAMRERMQAEADELGVTISDRVRAAVLEHLTSDDSALLRRVDELETRLDEQTSHLLDLVASTERLRESVGHATRTLLLNIVPSEQHKTVEHWVAETFGVGATDAPEEED